MGESDEHKEMNESPSSQGDYSSSLSSISDNCLKDNDEDQEISSDNEDNVEKPNGKTKTNKTSESRYMNSRTNNKISLLIKKGLMRQWLVKKFLMEKKLLLKLDKEKNGSHHI